MKFKKIILEQNANDSTVPANHTFEVLKNKLAIIRYH